MQVTYFTTGLMAKNDRQHYLTTVRIIPGPENEYKLKSTNKARMEVQGLSFQVSNHNLPDVAPSS